MAWVLFGDAGKYTLINSVGDYYNTLGRRQFYCLFNSLFGLTTKKTSRQSVPAPLWGELMYYREFPYKGPVMRKCFHGMTLSWEIATYKNASFILFIDDRFTVSMKTMSRRFDSFCRHWRHRWVVVMATCGVTVKDVVGGLVTILGHRC